MEANQPGFIDFFKEVPDHRIERRKLYSVEEILLLSFCGMIAGCDSWNDLELFGKTKLDYLRRYLPYEQGIPSDDTLRRFFRRLDPQAFEACFIKWVQAFQLDIANKIIAIDGKSSRRSVDGEVRPLHLISAFISEMGMTLGQLKTADKSNEITAIPELLQLLDIAGGIVTLDSMGCQTKIVEQIVDQQADYVIGLKGNQGHLHQDVRLFFEDKPRSSTFSSATEIDKGHGRLEIRHATATDDIAWLRERHPQWKQLNSVIEIQSQREVKGKTTIEKRYYLSSLPPQADKLLQAVRQHWGVENKLHWVLYQTQNISLQFSPITLT